MARGLKKAKAAKRARVELGDHGTPERRQHDPIKLQPADVNNPGVRAAKVMTESAIDYLLKRGSITQRMYDAAERLQAQYCRAAAGRRVIGSYNEPTTGDGEISDRAALAIKAVNEAIRVVGQHHSGIVVHVVLEDLPMASWALKKGLHHAAAADRLRIGLSVLADHYRLPKDSEEQKVTAGSGRIRAVRA